MNQRDILSHKTSECNRCENKHDITPTTTKRWIHARDHREDNESVEQTGRGDDERGRGRREWVTEVGGKDENTVEVNGFSLVFLSFSKGGGGGGAVRQNIAGLRENKALILHTALSTAEDSDQ